MLVPIFVQQTLKHMFTPCLFYSSQHVMMRVMRIRNIYPVDLVSYPYKSSKTKRFDPLGRFQVDPFHPSQEHRLQRYRASQNPRNESKHIKDEIKGTIYILSISSMSTFFPTLNLSLIYQNLFIYTHLYTYPMRILSSHGHPVTPVLFVDLPGWTPLPLIQRYQGRETPLSPSHTASSFGRA